MIARGMHIYQDTPANFNLSENVTMKFIVTVNTLSLREKRNSTAILKVHVEYS